MRIVNTCLQNLSIFFCTLASADIDKEKYSTFCMFNNNPSISFRYISGINLIFAKSNDAI